MHSQRLGPRAEYRQQEQQRVKNSATLAETFSELKSLVVDLSYFSPESFTRSSEVKYTVNLTHAKSLFRFECPNGECVGGDFDLSAELANAVAAHDTTATGEMICRGWRNRTTIDKVSCGHILRYKLTASY